MSQTKEIIFTPGTSAEERNQQIRDAMKEETFTKIIEGYLKKEGRDPIEYGWGNADLLDAEKIEVHFE